MTTDRRGMNRMKLIGTMIVACMLAGCAKNLPYSLAIGDPASTNGSKAPADCVLRLDRVVERLAQPHPAAHRTIRDLQAQFERTVAEEVLGLERCEDKKGQPVDASQSKIEEVAKKWLTTYSFDAADPDQSLERFREFLLSSKEAQRLAAIQIKPDESEADTYYLVEERSAEQSQWCGELTEERYRDLPIPPIPNFLRFQGVQLPANPENPQPAFELSAASESCLQRRSLYRIVTSPQNLYSQLLEEVVERQQDGRERDVRYFVLGYEIPWDRDRTLVRYGVTFFFRETGAHGNDVSSAGGPPSFRQRETELVGYDLIYANEATPEEKLAARPTPKSLDPAEPLPWEKNWWRITGYPFSLVIGVKNAAFEVVKVPFSSVAGVFFGRDGLNYSLQNLITAYNAFYVEATTQTRGGMELGLYRLLTEVPFVGQLFQYNFGADHSEPDMLPPSGEVRRKLFLSRGIYGGNKWGQDTGLWLAMANEAYPDYDLSSPAYRHGTVLDVTWSMFNLSHGPAYSEARHITEHATRKDRLYLAGHSGGVQRSAAASRILWHHGYKVIKVMGIAGPSIGQAMVDARYPDSFTVYLNTGSGANQDVVSKIGAVAGAFGTVLDYGVIVPIKYTLGGLFFWNNTAQQAIFRTADKIGFSNATIVEAERKPSSQHQTPLRLSFTDRLVFDAYVRGEFDTFFREDLERPERPSETDRPHAFPWSR